MTDRDIRQLWRRAKALQIFVVLGIAVAAGGMVDMIVASLVDPLRPPRLERLGVVIDPSTGVPKFAKPIQRVDLDEIISVASERRRRQSIINRAPPGVALLGSILGLVSRLVLSPFIWLAVGIGVVYLRMAKKPGVF